MIFYGEQNVLSAYIHKDETTPHMHFSFIPVTVDKDGKEKLCAKEVVDRKELKTIRKCNIILKKNYKNLVNL